MSRAAERGRDGGGERGKGCGGGCYRLRTAGQRRLLPELPSVTSGGPPGLARLGGSPPRESASRWQTSRESNQDGGRRGHLVSPAGGLVFAKGARLATPRPRGSRPAVSSRAPSVRPRFPSLCLRPARSCAPARAAQRGGDAVCREDGTRPPITSADTKGAWARTWTSPGAPA